MTQLEEANGARRRGRPPSPLAPERQAVLERTARALRRANELLRASDAPDDELAAAAAEAEALTARLERVTGERTAEELSLPLNVLPTLDGLAYVDHCPIFGEANAAAAPLRIVRAGDRVEATATYGRGVEGPPGHVHGGLLAAAFDGLFGTLAAMVDRPAMMGTLTVRFVAPAPLFRELRYTAWFEGEERRKRFARGTLHDGETLIAEAQGILITVSGTRFRELQAERDAGP